MSVSHPRWPDRATPVSLHPSPCLSLSCAFLFPTLPTSASLLELRAGPRGRAAGAAGRLGFSAASLASGPHLLVLRPDSRRHWALCLL